MKQQKKVRKSNFELLRIIAMIMIIMFHSVIETVTTSKGAFLAVNTEAVGAMRFIMDFFGNGGVTLFAMISGYFLITAKEQKNFFKKASDAGLKFAGLAVFNGVVVTAVFALLLAILNKLHFINIGAVLPANIFTDAASFFGFAGGYWYLSAYFILLVFLTPLNKFLNRFETKESFFSLIVVVVFVSTILNYVPIFSVRDDVNFPLVFIGYILGAFARKYSPLQNFSTFKIIGMIALFPIYFVVTFEFLVRVLHVAARDANPAVGYYVGFPVYIFAFLVFSLFMRLDFTNRFVNKIAPATVFVYIFHTATPYGLFYNVAHRLYARIAESVGAESPLLIMALPLVVLVYAVVVLFVGTVLYFIYEAAIFKVKEKFLKNL